MEEKKLDFGRLLAMENPEALLESAKPYQVLMMHYQCAMREVQTKFEVLNAEFSVLHDYNPVESIKSRLKRPMSVLEKLRRKGLPYSLDAVYENLSDVAGVRVICSFVQDIYALSDMLLRQDDITLIQRKDYIAHPKENGYRSLHLIVEIPIFLHNMKKPMKVEVQLRTISMDWWASLEHKIRYKKDIEVPEHIRQELRECAEISTRLDQRMEQIHRLLDPLGTDDKE